METDLGRLGHRSTIIVSDHFLARAGRPRARIGGVDFFQDMRQAGFGALEYPDDIRNVFSITHFARALGRVSDYVTMFLAEDVEHAMGVAKGFELIGARDFAAIMIALKRYAGRFASHEEFICAAQKGDAGLARIDRTLKALDWLAMSEKQSEWLRRRSDTVIVSSDNYRDALLAHTYGLRAG